MAEISKLGLGLTYKFDDRARTDNKVLSTVNNIRNGLLREAVEYFGEYTGDIRFEPKYKTKLNDTILTWDEIHSAEQDDLVTGILRFAKLTGLEDSAMYGSPSRWQNAVMKMAQWYVKNIHVYSQTSTTYCPLVGRNVRMDCSGFVTACMWMYGALSDMTWAPSSSAYTNDRNLGEKLSSAGFYKMMYRGLDYLMPFDVMTYAGHIEIYAGRTPDGRHISWSWGSCHDERHGGLPCRMAMQQKGYAYIWRCTGRGILSNITTGMRSTMMTITTNKKETAKAIYGKLMSNGCSDAAAKGILANMIEESQLDYTVTTWDGSRKTMRFGIGGGLCGFYFAGALPELAKHAWGQNAMVKLNQINEKIRNSGLPYPTSPCHPSNTRHIRSTFGAFPFSFDEQMDYICSVINKQLSQIKTMASASEAAMYWERVYERPAKIHDRWAKNGAIVESLLS